ncbi:MAG: hypothetical protein RDV48_29285 [Candidatus Eremiobacteraeota bacterium]|nr:hypothetical protein [Candidatus Eremiobacteraeota bacterium]
MKIVPASSNGPGRRSSRRAFESLRAAALWREYPQDLLVIHGDNLEVLRDHINDNSLKW